MLENTANIFLYFFNKKYILIKISVLKYLGLQLGGTGHRVLTVSSWHLFWWLRRDLEHVYALSQNLRSVYMWVSPGQKGNNILSDFWHPSIHPLFPEFWTQEGHDTIDTIGISRRWWLNGCSHIQSLCFQVCWVMVESSFLTSLRYLQRRGMFLRVTSCLKASHLLKPCLLNTNIYNPV